MLSLAPGEVSASCFIAPHPRLKPYLSTYYFTAMESSGGDEVLDWMTPEWASVRYAYHGATRGGIHTEPMAEIPRTHFVGPTTLASPFASHSARVASIGFLPLGWCRFMKEPASNWANRVGPAGEIRAHARFMDYWPAIESARDPAAIAAIFDAMLLDALDRAGDASCTKEALIAAAHDALINPDITSAGAMADHLGMTSKQLHRFSTRVFGFTPKLLIRRQRFIRTLAAVMHNPASNWAAALDLQYYDQSHFNRDFREFYGMSPEQYRREPHPVISAAARARTKALGDPLPALQRPVLGTE